MKSLKRITLPVLIFTLILSSFAYGQEAEKMTRTDFTKEIINTMEVEVVEDLDLHFTDISNEKDIPYIATAFNRKIVKGDGDNFYPENPVTKEEAVIMLVRALGVINIDSDEVSEVEVNFSDSEEISPWAKPFISYAVKYEIIENNEESFQPQKELTVLESKEMLNNFKEAFVRDGLTAANLLQLANDHLLNVDSYKFKGSIDMTTEVNIPAEDNNVPTKQVMESKMEQEAVVKTPNTIYVVSNGTTDINGEITEEMSEVYMKDNIMYMRTNQAEDWTKIDLNNMMLELQSSLGVGMNNGVTNPDQGPAQLSSAELELFGMYARYIEDTKIDDKEYYVVKLDIDSKAFKEVYTEIINEVMDNMLEGEMWEQMKEAEGIQNEAQEESFKNMMRETINQTILNMDIEMSQEYYINKENKSYDKLNLKQSISTNAAGVETKVDMDGNYEYYGFGEEVSFPEIPEDVVEMDF